MSRSTTSSASSSRSRVRGRGDVSLGRDDEADWEIDGAVVDVDEESVAARPMDDYFVCEVSANRAVNNVGPVRCHSVEAGR